MSKRPETYWTTEDAKKALREWRASGLSVSAFSKRVGSVTGARKDRRRGVP
jgi:hypothetical protein